jgi:hypothetical protein
VRFRNRGGNRLQTVRVFLIIQIALFASAALTHFGILIGGHQHSQARIAETVIGAVLLAGLLWTVIRPAFARVVAIAVQVFALLGTGIGIFTIVVGIGPRSMLDVVFHTCMVIALFAGLIIAMKIAPTAPATRSAAKSAHRPG